MTIMKRLSIFPIAVLAVLQLAPGFVRAAEEGCANCGRMAIATGQFSHYSAPSGTPVLGALGREALFREEIYGKEFSVSVPSLEPGRYTVVLGLAEVYWPGPGQRSFDITAGERVVASNLDLFAAAGGVNRVYWLTNEIEPSNGSIALKFTARLDNAKLNTFELKDASGTTLVSLSAASLAPIQNAALGTVPSVPGPELWKNPAQPTPVRVKDLVSRLTLAEKVAEMRNGASAVPRVGCRPIIIGMNACTAWRARAWRQSFRRPSGWPRPGMRRCITTWPT